MLAQAARLHMPDSLKTGVVFGSGSAIGMSAIAVSGYLGWSGLPFLPLILVPAGLVVGGAMAGITIDRQWPGAVARLGLTFVVGGIGALLSFFFIPYKVSREFLTLFHAAWLMAAFAVAGVVASAAPESRPCSRGRVLLVFAAGGMMGATAVILVIQRTAPPFHSAVAIGVICGFTVVGALIKTCFKD